MKKLYKEMLENKQVTEELLFFCLVTCEYIIQENAKWERAYEYQSARASTYEAERLEWSDYRTKIRKALQRKYEMKKIIAMSKKHTDTVGQATVKAVAGLIDTGEFTLI